MMRLRELKPDVAIDLQGLLRSGLMALACGARRRIGLADAREGARWFYTGISPTLPREHSVERYLRSLESLGIVSPGRAQFHIPPGVSISLPPQRFVLLHPFARGKGKSLSEENLALLCKLLQPATVIIAGTGATSGALPDNARDLLSRTTIPQLIWLIREAALVISVDSGPMHIAAALDKPLLSIHTWSDPRQVGPYSEQAWIWQGGDIFRQNLAEIRPASAKPITPADLEMIAAWARERFNE